MCCSRYTCCFISNLLEHGYLMFCTNIAGLLMETNFLLLIIALYVSWSKKIHLGFSRMKTDSSITPWFKYYTLVQPTWSKQQYTLWRKKAMVNKFAHYTPCVSWGPVSIAGSSGWSAFNGYIYAGSQNRFDQGTAFFSEISWESDAKPPGIPREGTEEWIKS